VPLAARVRSATGALAGAWVVTGIAFFSLAAGKRSVYLLPLFPALALLIGAGVATPPEDGRLARATRWGAALYPPAVALLAALAAAYALGIDPGAPLRRWLKPTDAAGAAALAGAAHAARPWLILLALVTAGSIPLLVQARRRADWQRLVRTIALVAVAWTAAFDGLVFPAIARQRSVGAFLAHVGRAVPPDVPLYAFFPPDPAVRFYAPRPLLRWPTKGIAHRGYLLLWEDEWEQRRDDAGRPLTVLSVSEAVQARRGHLALVAAPRGALVHADQPAATTLTPGLRRGSSRP
jgi:hypothetical protein